MTTETKLKTISEILSSLQLKLKAPKDQDNKFGNYKYRKAEDILAVYKEEIEKEEYPKGITLKHTVRIKSIGGRTFLKCTAILGYAGKEEEAEAYAELELSKKGMDLAQLTGAATSYAKKYALGNLFAIDDSKDDPDVGEHKEPKTPLQKVADNVDDMTAQTIFDFLRDDLVKCETLAELEDFKIKNKKSMVKLEKLDKSKLQTIGTIGLAKKASLELGAAQDDNLDDIGR